jgi:putative inorganic carbon (hco3(-)) transporter
MLQSTLPMTPLVAIDRAPSSGSILSALIVGYVALLPYQFQITSRLNFAPADCFLLLVLIFAAGQLKYVKQAWTIWHFGIAATFIIGSLVTSLRFGTVDQYELLNKDVGLILPLLSYAAITTCVHEWEDIRHLLRVFTLSVVIQNVVAVAGFLTAYFFGVANPFARYGGLRLSGLLLDPNAYGGLLVAALIIIEGSSWGPSPLFRRTTLWISRLTLGLGILFTFSRSAWVALTVALCLLVCAQARVAGRLVMALLVAAPITLLFMGRRFLPLLETMASRPKQVQGRFDLIHDAFLAFSNHPLLGGGIGSFRLGEGEIAHNSAMWFLADFGLVGLAVFLGFLGCFFYKGWLAYRLAPTREQPCALALLLGHAAMLGLAMGIEAFYQRHWWLFFALIASAYSLSFRRTNNLLCQT